jgi:hypothetical protein
VGWETLEKNEYQHFCDIAAGPAIVWVLQNRKRKEVTPESIESLAPGEALIFGRMRMIDNGKEKEN